MEPEEDGSVTVHVGFEVGDQEVAGDAHVRIVELPELEVASVVHRGAMDDIEASYEQLFHWIEDSGYRPAGHSRELYLEWHGDHAEENVTELQLPIAR